MVAADGSGESIISYLQMQVCKTFMFCPSVPSVLLNYSEKGKRKMHGGNIDYAIDPT